MNSMIVLMSVTAFTLTQDAFMDGPGLFEIQWSLILINFNLSVIQHSRVTDFMLSNDHTVLNSQNCCIYCIWINKN